MTLAMTKAMYTHTYKCELNTNITSYGDGVDGGVATSFVHTTLRDMTAQILQHAAVKCTVYLFYYAVIPHSPSFRAILLSYVRLRTLKEVSHHCIVLGSNPARVLSDPRGARSCSPWMSLLHFWSVHHVHVCIIPTRLAHALERAVGAHSIVLKMQVNRAL